MSLEILAGPPGSGKSKELIRRARAVSEAGGRCLWVGLPAQRASVYRRVTAEGGVTGFEFVTEQQLCYRLLMRAQRVRPIVAGTERLALVAQALVQTQPHPPSPGEAGLFAAGIAELKRYGLGPRDAAHLGGTDKETARLATVFTSYEELKGDSWDDDDYRLAAVELAEAGDADPRCALIAVAGFNREPELLPLTMRLLDALSEVTATVVALPRAPDEPPTGAEVTHLAPEQQPLIRSYSTMNEVEESRWVLRAIKRDLAEGLDPLDLALVVPQGQAPAYLALADEYSVPLMDESPLTLTELPAGRMLAAWLEAHGFVSAGTLLSLPGLEPLARVALERNLAGTAAIRRLAQELDREPDRDTPFAPLLEEWLARLDPAGAGMSWAEQVVALLPVSVLPADPELSAQFREQALLCARHAARLGSGAGFSAWWLTLLRETRLPRRQAAGVALLEPALASGRRYRKAYLAGAVEGAYGLAEREDYFIREELRGTALPLRFRNNARFRTAELLGLAEEELVVTHSASSQDGQLVPEEALTGSAIESLPLIPAGSRFETDESEPAFITWELPASRVRLAGIHLESLRRYADCPQRAWAEALFRERGEWLHVPEPWQQLRSAIRRGSNVDQATLDALAEEFPWAAEWLSDHALTLLSLRFRVKIKGDDSPDALPDAVRRTEDGQPEIWHLSRPRELDPRAAARLLRERWTERHAARRMQLLDRRALDPGVRLVVWPLLGEPVEAHRNSSRDADQSWLAHGADDSLDAWLEFRAGNVRPRPGFTICADCPVFDMCRKGVR